MITVYAVTALMIWGRLLYGLGRDHVLDGVPRGEQALWIGLVSVAAATWPVTFPVAVVLSAIWDKAPDDGC